MASSFFVEKLDTSNSCSRQVPLPLRRRPPSRRVQSVRQKVRDLASSFQEADADDDAADFTFDEFFFFAAETLNFVSDETSPPSSCERTNSARKQCIGAPEILRRAAAEAALQLSIIGGDEDYFPPPPKGAEVSRWSSSSSSSCSSPEQNVQCTSTFAASSVLRQCADDQIRTAASQGHPQQSSCQSAPDPMLGSRDIAVGTTPSLEAACGSHRRAATVSSASTTAPSVLRDPLIQPSAGEGFVVDESMLRMIEAMDRFQVIDFGDEGVTGQDAPLENPHPVESLALHPPVVVLSDVAEPKYPHPLEPLPTDRATKAETLISSLSDKCDHKPQAVVSSSSIVPFVSIANPGSQCLNSNLFSALLGDGPCISLREDDSGEAHVRKCRLPIVIRPSSQQQPFRSSFLTSHDMSKNIEVRPVASAPMSCLPDVADSDHLLTTIPELFANADVLAVPVTAHSNRYCGLYGTDGDSEDEETATNSSETSSSSSSMTHSHDTVEDTDPAVEQVRDAPVSQVQ